jgi:hypothetical protein
MFAGSSLLLVGFALVVIAIQLFTGFSLNNEAIAAAFCYVGLTLIGAVVLWTAQRVRRFDGMKPSTLSRREWFETASLLLVGLAAVALAIHLLEIPGLSDTHVAVAASLWVCGSILVGAGALCPFRLALSGSFIGFVVAAYLLITPATIDVNANETFKEVADKIAATHAESDGHSSATTSTSPQQSRSD